MDTNAKKRVLEKLWDNPETAFGIRFNRGGRTLTSLSSPNDSTYREKGRIRIQWTRDGNGITVHYNGGSRENHLSVFDYLQEYHGIGQDFKSTLIELSKMYGVEMELSPEERTQLQRQQLAGKIFPYLSEALQCHKDGDVYRYLTETRGIEPDGRYFGELTESSIEAVKEGLKAKGYSYKIDDFNALLHPNRAQYGYSCVIPAYTNGVITGFYLRDITGTQQPKILCSAEMGKPCFCDKLKIGKPAVMVEGPFDALRLMQAGIDNAVAMTGSGLSEDTARLLHSRGIHEITYIPDAELEKDGNRRTAIADRFVEDALKMQADGERVFDSVRIAWISEQEMNGAVKDADDYGRTYGPEALRGLIAGAKPWWAWKIARLKEDAAQLSESDFQNGFRAVYDRCKPFDREKIKQAIDGRQEFAKYGITVKGLEGCDSENSEKQYSDRVKLAVSRFEKDTESGMNREAVSRLAEALNDAQGTDTRREWERQLSQSWDDVKQAIKNKPEAIETKWELGKVYKDSTGGKVCSKTGKIELTAGSIEVFVAFTSHGKTLLMIQMALDLAKMNPNKHFLYIGIEEGDIKLNERAFSAYIDIPQGFAQDGLFSDTKAGATTAGNGRYVFPKGTRLKTIEAAFNGEKKIPYKYRELHNERPCKEGLFEVLPEKSLRHFNSLKDEVNGWWDKYGEEIFPRLKFVTDNGSAEGICSNIKHFLSDCQDNGQEVGAVFIDYAQLMTTEADSFNRTGELKEICKYLKDLAASIQVPVVIAAQFNREAMRKEIGFDNLTLSQIGESADIERIAHDVWMIWQVDKTKRNFYMESKKDNDNDYSLVFSRKNFGERSERIFTKDTKNPALKCGYLYVETMKAREGETGSWGLLPFDGESGRIGLTDFDCMTDNIEESVFQNKERYINEGREEESNGNRYRHK